MKKSVISGVLAFGILSLGLFLISPTSASAAGACLSDKTGLTEFSGLSNTDLLARLIYSEAGGESLNGKRGVTYVVKNRIAKNSSTFGGNTYSGVILKKGEFAGMTESGARCPSTSTTAWKDSLSIATSPGTNPVGKTLWFNANSTYNARSFPFPGYEGYSFDGGSSYIKVVEKYVIGGHTFFRVQGY
ncbi:cell wall hydrolase [Niallia sp. FSL R7-0271]|uniref:cell wall hydrolase n=1 Tax=Niallia sp. FSL R7-0271 TaxID=2921678 RepID=UPI0030F89064